MRNLLLFFIRYNGFFLFVLLEMMALFLMVQERNKEHHQAFVSTSNWVVGSLTERVNKVRRYWSLSSVNDSLAEENAHLYEQLRSAYFSHTVFGDEVDDTLYQQRYHYIVAEVVGNSTSRMNNFLTINRGSRHGVKPNMGVINGSGSGVLGIVRNVSADFATVMSVLHLDTRISARIKKNNFFGTLMWNGRSPRHMSLDAIPKHAPVQKGDTVVTSGYSGIFPSGITVGVIDSFNLEPGSNFYSIDVLLSGDLGNAAYAFVVDDLMHDELDSLIKKTEAGNHE